MKIPSILCFLLLILSCLSAASSAHSHDDFLECLSQEFKNYSSISDDVYTPANSSYTSVLEFSIRNLRFVSASTPKPQVIITPEHESQIPHVIYCAKQTGLEIRTRSGGHDLEGLSYVSQVPFVIIDLINLSEITVNAEEKTAWVEAGATIGALYYKIAEKSSTLGFPAGECPTVGVGGQFSGGGYGNMMRKNGLSSDNIIDARIIDVNGRILNRKSMGESLFWAIRGGGGASFGVIVAWKVQLVDVPKTVTVFRVVKQNATQLVHRWQYVAYKLDSDLNIAVSVYRKNSMIHFSFVSLFLGGIDRLIPLMQESFPELGLVREECSEMSWIQSVLYFSQISQLGKVGKAIESNPQLPLEVLLNRTMPIVTNTKTKSDYVKKPIPESGIEGIVRLLYELEADVAYVFMNPHGGRMAEISESDTPFPHRGGNLYKIFSLLKWQYEEGQDSGRYISWSRRYYSYLTPYVSRNPREAYLNLRDLDIGVNNVVGETSYAQASIWGKKYFKNNFDRLVYVKTIVDPDNFFKNEQSIPPFHRGCSKKGIEMHSSESVLGFE